MEPDPVDPRAEAPDEERRAARVRAIQAAWGAARGRGGDDTCAARSQDWLYDEDELPG